MTELKIAAGSWADLDEASLNTFSTTAALVVSDKAAYPEVEELAAALTAAASAYNIAYSRHKQFGGTDNQAAKDDAKAALYTAHQAIATKLEATANGNATYLTAPGYHLAGTGGKASLARVPAPGIKKVESAKVRGRVQFILHAANPRIIKGIVGRSSEDNGLIWQNGIHEYGLNFTLEGQPSGKAMLYQFKFRATNGRESDWSEPIRVDVF
jgi:hypothetical protein